MLSADLSQEKITVHYLEEAVRSLAQPAEVQQLFAENPLAGDEMAVDFDAWYVPVVRHSFLAGWSTEQCQALENIDSLLREMTAFQDMELWRSEALTSNPWWVKVRTAAQQAIQILSWSVDPPLSELNKTIIVIESKK